MSTNTAAEDLYGSAVWGVGPSQDLDQGGFASAIFTHETMDFASAKVKINVLQCLNAWKSLGYPSDDNRGWGSSPAYFCSRVGLIGQGHSDRFRPPDL
jgi:hypothetical protein